MGDPVKNPTLRILVSSIIFSLFSGVVVAVIGYFLGWKTSTQFSDGFFWAGAILITIGFVNLLGMFSQRSVSGLERSQSAVHLDAAKRLRIWNADILRGYNLLAFLMISAFLLFGLAALTNLVGRMF